MSPTIHTNGALLEFGRGISSLSWVALSSTAVGVVVVYLLGQFVYNIWFHPLSRFPGPKLAGGTRLYYCYYLLQGRLAYVTSELHEKYGDVVRIAPDELSYASAESWNQVYGSRPGKTELPKDRLTYQSLGFGDGGLLTASKERHGPIRKQISHGFSDRALKEQESVIRGYATLCMERLREGGNDGSKAMDIVQWMNFFTFDVIGTLVFGESFNCLQESMYHPWVLYLFDGVKLTAWIKTIEYFPILKPIGAFILPREMKKRRVYQQAITREKAESRKACKDGRLDLAAGLLLPDSDITDLEYRNTVETLITAGSETTASLLSGAVFYLLVHPDKLKRAVDEVRRNFKSEDEINLTSTGKLEYLLACLTESLRVYPPVPDPMPRNTGEVSELICGQTVPPRTTVGVSQWSTYRSSRNYNRPNDFVPERWLGDPQFSTDNKSALQPFLVGPRNCLGKNLAHLEMRLVLTLLLWNFDMELESSRDWADQRIFLVWQRPALMVKLHPHVRKA